MRAYFWCIRIPSNSDAMHIFSREFQSINLLFRYLCTLHRMRATICTSISHFAFMQCHQSQAYVSIRHHNHGSHFGPHRSHRLAFACDENVTLFWGWGGGWEGVKLLLSGLSTNFGIWNSIITSNNGYAPYVRHPRVSSSSLDE